MFGDVVSNGFNTADEGRVYSIVSYQLLCPFSVVEGNQLSSFVLVGSCSIGGSLRIFEVQPELLVLNILLV